jgi:hypothetical protein
MTKKEQAERANIVKKMLKSAGDDVGTRTLAGRLVKDFPDYFTSLELARRIIRYHRGANGVVSRKKLTDKSMVRKPQLPGTCMPPKSKSSVPKDWVDNKPGKWGILGDIHAPFHDVKAVEAAVAGMHKRGANQLYMNGDIVDLYHFSKWFSDPIFGRAEEHWQVQIQMLEWLTSQFDRVVYKMGNHEHRYMNFLGSKAAELMGIPTLGFNEVMRLPDIGITEVVAQNQLAYLGKCPILHGHELAKGFTAPVNPARGAFLKVKDSVTINHHHRSSTHRERTGLKGKMILCRSIGCLCQLSAPYQRATNWDHGFGVIEVDSRKDFEFSNFTMDEFYDAYRV